MTILFEQILKQREVGYEDSDINKDDFSDSTKISPTDSIESSSGLPQSWKDLEQLGPVGQSKRRSYQEIKEQYPDKTILTVHNLRPADFITDTLNEYLVKNGSSYVVYFYHIADEKDYFTEQDEVLMNVLSTDYFPFSENELKSVDELLNKVDIITLHKNLYVELSRNGCLEPWKDYLSTEDDRKLYQALPESNWSMCLVGDEIYGINGRADLVFGPPSYIVNKEIMKKYNLSEEYLNKPIYELDSVIKLIAEGEKSNPDFKPIVMGSFSFFNVFNTTPSMNANIATTAVALYNDITKKAGSVLDEPENIRWLRSMCDYANQGFVGQDSKHLKNFFIKVNASSSLPQYIPDYMFIFNNKGELAGADEVMEIILDDYYESSLYSSKLARHAVCISSASKYKEEAFDFLTRYYTDPYITNLLTYGIENKTFLMKEGKVEWPDIYNVGKGNAYISFPRNYEYADKKERYWKLIDGLTDVYCDFIFDPTNVKNEIERTNQVMTKISEILTGRVEDFDAFIADIKKQLDDSGLQKVLEEVNRQKDEWQVN